MMAGCSWWKETDEKVNYTKVCRLLVDGGTQAVRSVFDGIHPPSSLIAILNANKKTLQTLKKPKGKVLNNEQWGKLYPPSGSNPNSEDFDITLLLVLLRNICGLTAPATGWDVLPPITDNSLEANLARIKYYRNNTIAHNSNTEINNVDFEQAWQDISSALLSLGLCQDDIDELRSTPLGEKDYNQLLCDWYISDEDLKTQLENLKSNISDIKSDTTAIKSDTTDIKSETTAIKSDTIDIKSDTTAIKSDTTAIKSDTTAIKSDTTAIKSDTTAIKSDTTDIKSDTAVIKSDTTGIKLDTTAIKSDMTAIKSDTSLIPGIKEDLGELKNICINTYNESQHIRELAKSDFSSLIESLCMSFHPNTRQWILEQVKSHIYSGQSEPCAMQITAGPGMGKSTVAAKICEMYKNLGCLGGCHFFQFSNSTRNNPRLMLQSIARQMCDTVPGYRDALRKKLQTNIGGNIPDLKCEELFTVLFEEPLHKLKTDSSTRNRFVIVLDAIDECSSDLIYELVRVLKNKLSLLPTWLRFVITSRPSTFKLEKNLDINPEDLRNTNDLGTFFTFKLKQLYGNNCDPHLVVKQLVKISKGLFLVAFFVIDWLQKQQITPPSKILTIFENGISSVYERYFSRLKEVLLPYISEEERFYKMLEAVVASKRPLPVCMIYNILGLKSERAVPRTKNQARQDALNSLHSLFPVMNDHVTVFHKTVVDWLILKGDEVHEFSVRLKDGIEVLSNHCYGVLSDIQNGKKDLDKPLMLSDSEKFSLIFALTEKHTGFRKDGKFDVFKNYFILCAMMCGFEYRSLDFNLDMKFDLSDEWRFIFDLGSKYFSPLDRAPPGDLAQFVLNPINHHPLCPLTRPSNFGSCVEFVLNVAHMNNLSEMGNPLELLKKYNLSHCERQEIVVDIDDDIDYAHEPVPCENGFLLVQECEEKIVLQKYKVDGTCLAKKSFSGEDKDVLMSLDNQFFVVAEIRGKNIEIINAKTLEQVTRYQFPNVIRSCHVFGDQQPWYILARCYDNKLYVMEGQTGLLIRTYAHQVNKSVEVKAVSKKGHIVLGRPDSGMLESDDADGFFTDGDGNLLEDNFGMDVPHSMIHLKHLLLNLESDLKLLFYPPRKSDILNKCMQGSDLFGFDLMLGFITFQFSSDGTLLAYSHGTSVFVINTSDGSLYKRVCLGPEFKIYKDGILFFSEAHLVVYEFSVIMFIDVQTNEIKHRFLLPNSVYSLRVIPNTKHGDPFRVLTGCNTETSCVEQYLFYI